MVSRLLSKILPAVENAHKLRPYAEKNTFFGHVYVKEEEERWCMCIVV